MARVEPLEAIHYDLDVVGPLEGVISPPYDVIDEAMRAELLGRSQWNIVELDLPVGEKPYEAAAGTLDRWLDEGVLKADAQPAIWAVEQTYASPADGSRLKRSGFLARIAVEEYGEGRVRPHERTHPGPKEDRLRLTRATRANLSPIFALYSDPSGVAAGALAAARSDAEAWGEAVAADGAETTVWRVDDPVVIAAVCEVASESELLIADGHHRYETARTYLGEEEAASGATHVLAYLVALEDPGLVVFPTHRLVSGLDAAAWEALDALLAREFEAITLEEAAEPSGLGGDQVEICMVDGRDGSSAMLRLKDAASAERALPAMSGAYRQLDTAILESLILRGALGLDDERIDHLDDFGYARDLDEAVAAVASGTADVAFVMGPTPVERIQAIAAAGENMPPKSTYFFPKIPTGLVINPLGD